MAYLESDDGKYYSIAPRNVKLYSEIIERYEVFSVGSDKVIKIKL